MFSPDVLNISCHSEHFVENGKGKNHLLPDLVNMVNRTDQPKSYIFYSMILAKCGLMLS